MATRSVPLRTAAERLGLDVSTLTAWTRVPAFRARVAEVRAAVLQATQDVLVAEKAARLRVINDLVVKALNLIAARAQDPELANVPGYATGLLVRKFQGVGRGADFRLVEEYVTDTSLITAIRELLKQAAIEVGEWNDKATVDLNATQALTHVVVGVDLDKV